MKLTMQNDDAKDGDICVSVNGNLLTAKLMKLLIFNTILLANVFLMNTYCYFVVCIKRHHKIDNKKSYRENRYGTMDRNANRHTHAYRCDSTNQNYCSKS